MTHPEFIWWKHGVIYQIYPRSFKDSTGNGIGDLQGIIDRLDYLVDLGIDALWISPCFPSPMADFGYDVADYTDIHPLFGDLETMDALLGAAHARDLRVILDFVPNHSSDQHPWFLEARSSRDNPRRDWYIWRDAQPDGSPPNNWLSVFGGSAWEWDAATGQYYLHSFLKEQPDLNWRNPQVQAAMFDVLRFWLERGVDGFRVDVAHFIMKDPQLRDNPSNPSQAGKHHRPLGAYDSQLHIHDLGHPDVHAVYRRMRELLNAYDAQRPRFMVGEIHIFDWEEWARYYGPALDEFHMPFNFALLKAPWTATGIRQVVDALEGALPPGAWPNYVLGNHDEPRLASRMGAAQARVAALLLLTLRGAPTLYYGDEIGMKDGDIKPEEFQDPWPITSGMPELSRDPCRTPMQWTDGPGAGFSPLNENGVPPKPWLPVHANYQQVNVAVEQADPDSLLNLYKRLLHYRRGTPALTHGSYQPVGDTPAETFIFLRQFQQQRRLVALNFSPHPQRVGLPGWGQGQVDVATDIAHEGRALNLSGFELPGDTGYLISLSEVE